MVTEELVGIPDKQFVFEQYWRPNRLNKHIKHSIQQQQKTLLLHT